VVQYPFHLADRAELSLEDRKPLPNRFPSIVDGSP